MAQITPLNLETQETLSPSAVPDKNKLTSGKVNNIASKIDELVVESNDQDNRIPTNTSDLTNDGDGVSMFVTEDRVGFQVLIEEGGSFNIPDNNQVNVITTSQYNQISGKIYQVSAFLNLSNNGATDTSNNGVIFGGGLSPTITTAPYGVASISTLGSSTKEAHFISFFYEATTNDPAFEFTIRIGNFCGATLVIDKTYVSIKQLN